MNIKDYFAFTKGEKRGVVVLLSIIVLITVGIQFIKFFRINEFTDFSRFDAEISQFEKERAQQQKEGSLSKFKKNETPLPTELFDFNPNTIEDSNWLKLGFASWQIKTINNYKSKGGEFRIKSDVGKIYGVSDTLYQLLYPYILLPEVKASPTEKSFGRENKFDDTFKKEATKITYFNFDPNTISKEQWGKLGFKDWQIKTIFNYKEKGGKWKTKADVKKIYGLSETDYYKLEPFVLLPDEISKPETSATKKDYTKKVNINTANAKELTNLKGISSEKYAEIIVKYRTELGGFVKKEQLKEVWNLKIETYNEFVNQLELGAVLPQQLNLNKATAEELKVHPYIDWNMAKAIIAYKKSHGNFKNVEDIKQIHLITDEIYSKIAPYLTVK
ncbi:MAG: helix-hairpin-helix domain-containing protein [Bacteroidetes bacterium]|nr:helix-hairpin-helix domain-containing protein [Bacteroidota bacterium]